jgi:hypothetical protein
LFRKIQPRKSNSLMTTECNRLVSDFVPKSDARCGRRFHGGSDQLGEIRASAEGIRGEKE